MIRSNALMGVWKQPDCEWLHVTQGVLWVMLQTSGGPWWHLLLV